MLPTLSGLDIGEGYRAINVEWSPKWQGSCSHPQVHHHHHTTPPLKKLRHRLSYSGCRHCINLGPNLIRYQMCCSHNRYRFANKIATYMRSWTHVLGKM